MENDNMPCMALCGRGRQTYCSFAAYMLGVYGESVKCEFVVCICLHMYASSGMHVCSHGS